MGGHAHTVVKIRNILFFILGAMFFSGVAYAQSVPSQSPWWVSGSFITPTPLNVSLGLKVPSLASLPCIGTNGSGTFGAGTCGGSGGIATSTLTATYPVKVTVGASTINYSLLDMATTTISCSGSVSCSSFTVIGTSPVTITSAALTTDPNWVFSGVYLQPTTTRTTLLNGGFVSQASSTVSAGLFNAAGGASTTNSTVSGNLYLASLSGVLLGNNGGAVTAGSTQTCTNQFVRSLSNAYIASCATVSLTADVTGTLPVGNGGTGQTSFTSGNLLYGTGSGGLQSAATTTASCSGSASCTPFTVIGSSPVTISASGGGGGSGSVGTSTADTPNQIAVFSSTNATPALIGGYSGFTWANASGLLNVTGKLNIATTTSTALNIQDQYGTNRFTISTASSTGSVVPNILQIQSSTTADTLFSIDDYGHLTASSTPKAPTVTCAPSGGTIVASSNDVAGEITTGTLSTSCTVTFGAAYSVTPLVFVQQTGTASILGISAQSTTAFTVSLGTAATGDSIQYFAIMP